MECHTQQIKYQYPNNFKRKLTPKAHTYPNKKKTVRRINKLQIQELSKYSTQDRISFENMNKNTVGASVKLTVCIKF